MPIASPTRSSPEVTRLRQDIERHVRYSLGCTIDQLSPREMFNAVALVVRDRMVDSMLETEQRYQQADAKRLYYLSMEFLIGRSLRNNLVNLQLWNWASSALQEMGFDLDEIEETEVDAALGNGGLGRLAACFLDSLATLGLPGFGYGINYEYGLFRQEIRRDEQIEKADNWRMYYTPWEIERPQDAVVVPIYGRIEHLHDRDGHYNPMWLDWQVVIGVPYDVPICGFNGRTVNYLRLYSARASQDFDMSTFNEGEYVNAVHKKVQSETISKVLYPSDSVARGLELRLLQEYFLVACAVRDLVRRFVRNHDDYRLFPEKVAIQLNDTHPTLAIAELMRIFVDENDLPWELAWDLTRRTFAYTNHTLLPEALERWPVPLMQRVLPRHMQIIFELNHRFMGEVVQRWPGDVERLRKMSLIEESEPKKVRMANLCIIGGHSVNGVAAVHSRLVQTQLVPEFYQMWPEKFNNKTNGVTQRRWLLSCNPDLANLITSNIGDKWVTNLDQLKGLEAFAHDAGFQEQFLKVKRANKERLAKLVKDDLGETLDPDAMFDIQIKRIHEYKRQLLNLLHVIHDYLCIVEDGKEPPRPKVYIFAGKAAPGYYAAKQIIAMINHVAGVINRDVRANSHLKVVFLPDYRVSLAEVIIPSADLSEQVSTAGTEASGTGNMKFTMNGALTIGTMDGANIEICEEVGEDNIFIFGLSVEQVKQLKASGSYRPYDIYQQNPHIRRVLDSLRDSRFCPRQPGRHRWVYDTLLAPNERYYHLADMASFTEQHDEAMKLFCSPTDWAAKAILNVARVGKFSSDRTIADYAREIWNIQSF